MSGFHRSRAWRKLAKAHKTLRCACNSTIDIESAHYLPQSIFPLVSLWRVNLYHGCKVCNGKLGNRIKWSIRAVLLLLIYPVLWAVHKMIKGFIYLIIILMLAFLLTLVYKDVGAGGFETSFTGQILISWWEWITNLCNQYIPI